MLCYKVTQEQRSSSSSRICCCAHTCCPTCVQVPISPAPEQQVLPQSVLSWVWCLFAIPTTERLRQEICQEFDARTSETPSPPPLPKSLGPQHLGNEYELISVGKLKVLNTEL